MAGTGLRPANLNQADAEVLDLISKVRADIRARATLLGQARRTDLERVIQRYEQTQRSQLTYVSEALGHSKKIAATATGSESHTTAASAFRAARQRAAALDDQLSRDQPACREGQAELARDDQRRAAAGPAMLAGQRADAALRTRIRARINTMLSNFDLPPAWFTAALGYRPPAQATASWLETATDLLVYRITHGISHQTAALGEARPPAYPGSATGTTSSPPGWTSFGNGPKGKWRMKMDDAELDSLEQGMRVLLTELGLDWVRANIDEGIAVGVRKEVLVPQGASQPNEPVPLFDGGDFQYKEPPTTGRGQRMIGNVRLSPGDRVQLITQALHRLIVELPEVHEDIIKRLASTHDPDAAAQDLLFLPDEDDTAQTPPGLEAVTASQARMARQAAAAFLARLDREVSAR